ncbi:MAG: hypothetical protein QMC37_09120, partial [Flavobacteriales bacterium]
VGEGNNGGVGGGGGGGGLADHFSAVHQSGVRKERGGEGHGGGDLGGGWGPGGGGFGTGGAGGNAGTCGVEVEGGGGGTYSRASEDTVPTLSKIC